MGLVRGLVGRFLITHIVLSTLSLSFRSSRSFSNQSRSFPLGSPSLELPAVFRCKLRLSVIYKHYQIINTHHISPKSYPAFTMRFLSSIVAAMATLAVAAPLPAQEQQAAAAIHPAVSPLGQTTLALTNVVSEINNFKGDEFAARRLEQDAYAAIEMLANATQEILRNPDVDYLTALQFVPVAPPLFLEAYQLVNTLNGKQKELQSTPSFAARTSGVLDRTYAGVQNLALAIEKKFPGAVVLILKGMDDDVVNKIKTVVEKYAASAPPSPYGVQVIGTADPNAYPAYPAYQQVNPAPKYQPYNAQAGSQAQPSWNTPQAQSQPRPQAQYQPRPQSQSSSQPAQPVYAQPQYAAPQPQYPSYPQAAASNDNGYQPAGMDQDSRNAWPQWTN